MGFLRFLLRSSVLALLGLGWLLAGVYLYLDPGLPDVETLRDVRLQTPMQVYTRDGDLIGQFGEQKRNPLRFEDIPPQFVQALLAAEDDRFFAHRGVDLAGLMRAVSELALTGEKGSGGSTLTMQVARNYFLSLERTFTRKFNEILLAIKIERALDKEEIFELYFNRVFLGHRAYGFEAAAQVYYGSGIKELTLAQHAMLAGIPKAPSRNNPISGPQASKERRDWILGRMLSLGYIDRDSWAAALAEPASAQHHGAQLSFAAHYAAEMARQEMLDRYGMAAYTDGYHVYTTISSELQQLAQETVVHGLMTYDRRHGYRGPERQLPPDADAVAADATTRWLEALAETPVVAGLSPAIVTRLGEDRVDLLFNDGSTGELLWDDGLRQASPYLTENSVGRAPASIADVVAVGDLIRVQRQDDGRWHLSQVPAAQAALVSLDPDNGAIISIVGGLGFENSKFNRATQARRQPGSSFKPFVYSAALEAGFTAASIINDAPVVLEDASLEDIWRPENDGGRFYGPTRLRWALTQSRNLVSIRLLQQIGVPELIRHVARFGFDTSQFAPDLSLALGTHVMSPLELATAYAVLANGGYAVKPYLIERIEDIDGNVIFEAAPATVCRECPPVETPVEAAPERELRMEEILAGAGAAATPEQPRAERVMDERSNFILTSILQDVIKRGTGRRALTLGRNDLAGKTGTTNGPMDAWFSGYNRDVVTTAWVGFDNYTPLGRREFGGTAALPIWIDYMRGALRNSPDVQPPLPPGVVHVRIDPDTGLLARPGQQNAIFEYFREDQVPAASGGAGDSGLRGTTEDLVRDIF
ncbi:MAG: peptidase [Haliea sp.]|uniref:penicillin-binding protein 1A n=1 Tax=Haliea sp. TaxID=1932666 RepID=UPI000C59D8CF|nr:penicillin-binding protein 1A [Haliea sp.]MBM69192.1 peptidase [Haliea sp.]|tara:strand:+ start:30003 stop:32453 length:2451 start_codon:yes stop_codon:yes gene_type:complete